MFIQSIHSLKWVLTKYLPQLKLTFIEEILGRENACWNFVFKRVQFYEDYVLWFKMKKKNAYGNWEEMIYGWLLLSSYLDWIC